VVIVVLLFDHKQHHDFHHDTKVKPEANTAVIELLMMGGKTLETCWAVIKRQDKKVKNFCIWLVIYLNLSCILLFNFPWRSNNGIISDLLCSWRKLPASIQFFLHKLSGEEGYY
jgi:hypothetical protein